MKRLEKAIFFLNIKCHVTPGTITLEGTITPNVKLGRERSYFGQKSVTYFLNGTNASLKEPFITFTAITLNSFHYTYIIYFFLFVIR